MKLEKLSPWNWFKSEEESHENQVPVRYGAFDRAYPLSRIHEDIDRMFEDAFRGFGLPSMFDRNRDTDTSAPLRPNLDIEEKDDHYMISVEVPGVEESNVEIQLHGRSLVISGEKSQESKDESGKYHRVERSYGSFKRVLSLPDNADADKIDASFKDGVLKIRVDKDPVAKSDVKRISISHA